MSGRRDLDQAKSSRHEERHEWACFAAHQAAEKAPKAVHLHHGQDYVPTRYLNGHVSGLPSNTTERCRATWPSQMPLRSLNSPLLKWPDRAAVLDAASEWARRAAEGRPTLQQVGVFGSYARGDWGVGSDLDLVAVVGHSGTPPEQRPAAWDTTALPSAEWEALIGSRSRFATVARDEIQWLWTRQSVEGRKR